MTDRMAQLQKALDGMGNTHDLDDIRALIESGVMQSFAQDETWVVTQILDLPRKRVLEIFLVVGDMANAQQLYPAIFAFAKETGCSLVRCFGRDGWKRKADANGWANGYRVFTHEVM